MFDWRKSGGGLEAPYDSYNCHGFEVARLSRDATGRWRANLYWPDGRRFVRDCQSFATGQRGVEVWAERHREVLGAWCRERLDAWRVRNPHAGGARGCDPSPPGL